MLWGWPGQKLGLVTQTPEAHGFYSQLKLTEPEIQSKAYKRYLGGGERNWERRGTFQLFFLRQVGLEKSHRVLDIGCGPLRAGLHFIGFLDAGKYHGVDYNADFIRSAKQVLAEIPSLAAKSPVIRHADKFGFSAMKGTFDYVLVFSVLNHCTAEQLAFFFNGLYLKLHASSKVFITHALWFREEMLEGTHLRLRRTLTGASEIAPGLKMQDWGWDDDESIFPILELGIDPDPHQALSSAHRA